MAQRSRSSGPSAAAALCALVIGVAACALPAQRPGEMGEVRLAQDTPVRFVTTDDVVPEDACHTLLLDPRDQTPLRLHRSTQFGMSHRGDYDVPAGRYGVQRGELLRLDCATGEVIGIVRS
jgi:hypothetical protein